MQKMIRVCLVEDQTIVRQGLRTLLDLVDDIEVAGEAEDGIEALAAVPVVNPDVLLLDVRMPRLDGLGVMTALKSRGALPPTIVLTTFEDDDLALQSIRAGAKGFLLKDVTLERLSSAIREVAQGKTLMLPGLTERAAANISGRSAEFPSLELPDPLTRREVEILRLLAGGYSNKEIAGSLELAEGTVKNHVSRILSKLGVRDRTRAVLRAADLGYLN